MSAAAEPGSVSHSTAGHGEVGPAARTAAQRAAQPATRLTARLAGGTDPWAPERSVWPLLALVDEHIDDPLMRPLAAHLRAASPAAPDAGPRRFTAVRHLADLYDHYAVHRPDMLLAWQQGTEAAIRSGRPEDMTWQAELWRLLRRRLAVPSPAERFSPPPHLSRASRRGLICPRGYRFSG